MRKAQPHRKDYFHAFIVILLLFLAATKFTGGHALNDRLVFSFFCSVGAVSCLALFKPTVIPLLAGVVMLAYLVVPNRILVSTILYGACGAFALALIPFLASRIAAMRQSPNA